MLQLVTHIGDSYQCQKVLISTWKDHNRNILIHLDPNIPIMVLPGTDWSFEALTRVPCLWQAEAPKKELGSTFCSYSVMFASAHVGGFSKGAPISPALSAHCVELPTPQGGRPSNLKTKQIQPSGPPRIYRGHFSRIWTSLIGRNSPS